MADIQYLPHGHFGLTRVADLDGMAMQIKYIVIADKCALEYAIVDSRPLPQTRDHPNRHTLISLGWTTQLSCESSCTSTFTSLSLEPVSLLRDVSHSSLYLIPKKPTSQKILRNEEWVASSSVRLEKDKGM